MKIERRKPRPSNKPRRPHARCCPCLFMCGMSLESCHFYTDLGCFCCNVRSARLDGRDLRKRLKSMPENLDGQRSHFRFHALNALAAEVAAGWDDAILHYEACRQILSEVQEKLPRSLHLWLLMWASTPLVSLYHLTNQNFAKSVEISEMLLRCLQLRMEIGLRCWKACSKNLKFRHRCCGRLSRILMELQLAHDALDRDRRLAYYEWSHESPTIDDREERKRSAFEGIETEEHALCQWLSKLHKQYGDLGRALYWASVRKNLRPQCSVHGHHDEEHWKHEIFDAELLRDSGDAQRYKERILDLQAKTREKFERQDGKDLDPEALVTVENLRNDIYMYSQFFADMPVKQGTILHSSLRTPRNQITSNSMDELVNRGLKLHLDWMNETIGTSPRSQRREATVSFYRDALDEVDQCQKGLLRNKHYTYRLEFLDMLGTLFSYHYHEDGRAMRDLDTLIQYVRKLYSYTWMTGSRADESILNAQRHLGWVYGIKAIRNFNANDFQHDLEWDSTSCVFKDWHVYSKDKIELDLVISQGLAPPDVEAFGESEMMEWVDQKYRGLCITGFIKAWRMSMKHNKIAAVMGSNILHRLGHSPHQLDDTWAIYELPNQDLVYDGLQARLEEGMKIERLLATCCKGVPMKKKIMRFVERNSTSSGFTPKSLPWALEKAGEEAYTCCEGFAGDEQLVNSMSPAQEALLWAERNRTRLLIQQLLPNRLHRDAFDKLHNFDLQDQVAWDTIKEAKNACGKGAVIVEYSYCHYDLVYLAYVFDQDGRVEMRSIPFEDEAHMESLVGDVLRMLSARADEDFATFKPEVEEKLKELYFILIETIGDLLEHMTNKDKLVIVPFEGLTELPFQLLLDGDGKYLFEKFVLSTTPSLRTIKYLSERLCTLQRYSLVDQEAVLVVGDAAFNLEEERLSESRKEVRLISSIFEGKVLELLGRRASVQNVLDWGRRPSASSNQQEFCQAFMHIATHGQVNETYKKGALQLAHPKAPEWEDSDEGYSDEDSETSPKRHRNVSDAVAALPSAEIGGVMKRRFRNGSRRASKDGPDMLSSDGIVGCGFDWRAYMVVLSACDSGKGKVLSEGVLNLPRAFLVAGVPCIVASQWLVDDKLTPELMEEFYGCMKQGSDVAEALCHSMRLMKRRHEQDLNKWGAFNVWGLPTVCLPKELQAGYIAPPAGPPDAVA